MPCYNKKGQLTPPKTAKSCSIQGGTWRESRDTFANVLSPIESGALADADASLRYKLKGVPLVGSAYSGVSDWAQENPKEAALTGGLTALTGGLYGAGRAGLGYLGSKLPQIASKFPKVASKTKELQKLLFNKRQLTKAGKPSKLITGKPAYGGLSPAKLAMGAGLGAYGASKLMGGQQQPAQTLPWKDEEAEAMKKFPGAGNKLTTPPTLMEKMKTKGYWKDSLSGLEGDNRLSRMATLMNYYGKPLESQRAQVKQPEDVFAGRQQQVLEAIASAKGSKFDTGVGKQTFNSAVAQVVPLIKEMTAGFMGIGDDLNEEEITTAAKEVVTRALDYSKSRNVPFSVALEAVLIKAGYKTGDV
jgi:hypothetical protein